MAIKQIKWLEMPDGNKYEISGFYYIAGTGSTAGTWLGSHNAIVEYYDGLTIAYKTAVAGASTTTLNINGLGAKNVYRNANSKITTHYPVGSVVILTYVSTGSYPGWHCADYDSNTNATHSGIGICSTAASTAAKVVTMPNFALVKNQTIIVRVNTTNSATSGVTLNVNSTGAKSIYVGGSAWSTSNQLNAGDYLATYDGTYWKLTRIYLTDNDTVITEATVSGWGFTKNTGDITGVTAGNGLTGGATSGNATLNVGAGNGISVAADTVSAKAGTAITVDSNGIHNAGVRSVVTGDTNGTVKVNTNGSAVDVKVKGLGTLAYQNLSDGKIPSTLLPSYVDDVIEGYYNTSDSKFYKTKSGTTYSTVITGESGKIYVDLTTNKTYRWSGSAFVEISASLAIGTTNSTAAAGNHKHTIDSHTHSITRGTGTVYSITDPGTLPSLTTKNLSASKITGWNAGSAPTSSEFTYVDGVKTDGTVSVVTGVAANGTTKVITGVSGDGTANVITGVTSDATGSAVTGVNGGSGYLKVYSSDSATTEETLPTSKRIAYVASINPTVSASSTATVLKGVKASSTGDAAPSGHTHKYDKATSITLGANSSTADGRIQYVESITGGGVSVTGTGNAAQEGHTHTVTVNGTSGKNSGTGVTVATGTVNSSGTGSTVVTGSSGTATVLTGVKASGTNKSVDTSWSAGVLTFTERTFVTGVASNGTTTAVTGLNSGKLVTSTAAPNEHTHSYGSSTALTTSVNNGTPVSAATAVGYTKPTINYKYLSASLNHTSTDSGANSGDKVVAITGITSNGTATAITGISINAGATTKYLLHGHTGASASGNDTFLKSVKASGNATVLTSVKATGDATVLTGVKASGTATVIKSDGLSTDTANSITSLGSAPSLTYDSISIKGVDTWSTGTLPTKGSAQTVVTSVNTTTGGTSLTTNTPS